MARDRKDRSANWYMAHHGGALLRLANLSNVVEWKAVQNVLGFPKQIPDGLLDVTFAGKATPDPCLIEIESYPESNTADQIRRDLAMVLLMRQVIPDILVLVVHPKGKLRIEPEQVLASAHGLTEFRLKVHVVNLWTLSAEELLATGDVGLIPCVPLTQYAGKPRAILEECRDRIEQEAKPEEQENLLAVTRVMAEMRYNDAQLLGLLRGRIMSFAKVIMDSPAGQRFLAEKERKMALRYVKEVLRNRFGELPKHLAKDLSAIKQLKRIERLHVIAATCSDVESFRVELAKLGQ